MTKRVVSSASSAPNPLLDYSPTVILLRLEEALAQDEENSDLRTSLILRHSLQYAVEHGNVELISWLVGLQGEWAEKLEQEVHGMEDEDGWGIVGMAIQATCGRQEREERVRAIVMRWGLRIGHREGRDRSESFFDLCSFTGTWSERATHAETSQPAGHHYISRH